MKDPAGTYSNRLKRAFGDRVPPRDHVEVCRCLYPSILGLFYEVAQLDADVRVQRIWVEGARLRVSISRSAPGFDDIFRDIKAEAAAAIANHCNSGGSADE